MRDRMFGTRARSLLHHQHRETIEQDAAFLTASDQETAPRPLAHPTRLAITFRQPRRGNEVNGSFGVLKAIKAPARRDPGDPASAGHAGKAHEDPGLARDGKEGDVVQP
jgi:hypothetical protein